MAEPPKKRVITGLDISRLSNVRPTKIPSAIVLQKIRQHKIDYRRLAIDAGILALIVLVTYGVSLICGFVFNDHYIDKFLAIKVTEQSFLSNLVMRAIIQPLSQPWIVASFVLDLQNFGLDPSWYHIVNILLHFLSCFYFYILVYRLAKYFWNAHDQDGQPTHEVALVAAAFFGCHPLICESVSHISGCVSTIASCNFMLALNFFLWGFLSHKNNVMARAYSLTFIFFVWSILSDWQAVAMPWVMLLLICLLKPSAVSFGDWLKSRWADTGFVIFFAILTIYFAKNGFAADFSNGFAVPLPSWTVYVASQFRSLITYYLRCFVIPVGLSVYPPFTSASGLTDFIAILGLIVLLIACYLIYKWKEKRLIAFGLGLAVLTYLPQIFFVQNEIAADRRFYFSVAGLSLMVAALLTKWLTDWRTSNRVKMAVVLLIVIPAALTVVRTLDFRSDISLLKAAMRVNASDTTAQGMLALELVNAQKFMAGIEMAKAALKVDKKCQPAYLALGRAFMPERKIEDILNRKDMVAAIDKYRLARGHLEQAMSLAKAQHLSQMQLFFTALSLASDLIEINEYQRAKEVAEEGLAINPNSIVLNLIMGRSLNGLGKHLLALTYLNKSFERDRTNPDCIEPLIEAGLGANNPRTINMAYNAAKLGVKVKQNHNMHLLMARAAFAMGQFPESFQWMDTALHECPDDAKAIYLSSYQWQAIGDLKKANKWRTDALKMEPDLKKKMPIVIVTDKEKTVIPFDEFYAALMAKRK